MELKRSSNSFGCKSHTQTLIVKNCINQEIDLVLPFIQQHDALIYFFAKDLANWDAGHAKLTGNSHKSRNYASARNFQSIALFEVKLKET